MRDSVNDLFQQRFQGHETSVDPGVWQSVQQQLAASAPAADGVSELFKERFHGHEVHVDPSAWASISGQLGHTAVGGAAGGTLWAWVAAGVGVIAVGAGALFMQENASKAAAPARPSIATTIVVPSSTTHEADVRVEAPASAAATKPVEVVKARPSGSKRATAETITDASTAPPAPLVIDDETQASSEGREVVTDIIAGLTEEVIHKPLTAQPEPGLSVAQNQSKSSQDPLPLNDAGGSPNAPEQVTPLPKLFMPNTFTPNGDLVNDSYTVGAEGFQAVMIRVYSLKSNTLVFSTNNGEAWTGSNCEDGMYMVAAEAQTLDGRTVTDGKVVWLNRNPTN